MSPPIVGSSRPATASIASRHASTSSRRRFIRQSSLLPGSRAKQLESCRLLWRYVEDSMISRCIALMRPSRGDESTRQPVEQLGVAGPFSRGAEVAGRLDQPSTEVVLPDSVDHHPRGERVAFRCERMRQIRAGRCRARTVSDRRRKPSRNGAATLAPGVAALPRIKTGASIGRAASPSVWITGNWGRSLFLQAGRARSAARRASSWRRQSAWLRPAYLVAGHLDVSGGRLPPSRKRRDLFILGLDRGLGGLVGVNDCPWARRALRRNRCWRKRLRAHSNRWSGSGRTCGRGNGRRQR